MSYGNIIVTVRCKIQLVEIILFSLRQTATVVKTTKAEHGRLDCLKCSYGPGVIGLADRSFTLGELASCLINAQPLPAHSPAADDNSLIGCTNHDLTDDWSLASIHISVLVWERSFIEPDVLTTIYRSTIPLRLT